MDAGENHFPISFRREPFHLGQYIVAPGRLRFGPLASGTMQ